MIDDEQKIIKIKDDGEGKAHIVNMIDLSHHDLEDELAMFDARPWTSFTICDRMLALEDFNFSL